MGVLVDNCPRCGSKHITFDVKALNRRPSGYDWQYKFEAFSICRHCSKSTTFFLVRITSLSDELERLTKALAQNPQNLSSISASLNTMFNVEGYISLKDVAQVSPPEHLPKNIENAFSEGAACFSIGCFNAAATMFRLCLDLATQPLLPDPSDTSKPQPNAKQRRDLGLRIPWLLDQGLLPEPFRDLAHCIREDANDGAHVGSLTKQDAEDVLDFTTALLERLVTEPAKLDIAKKRREARRKP